MTDGVYTSFVIFREPVLGPLGIPEGEGDDFCFWEYGCRLPGHGEPPRLFAPGAEILLEGGRQEVYHGTILLGPESFVSAQMDIVSHAVPRISERRSFDLIDRVRLELELGAEQLIQLTRAETL